MFRLRKCGGKGDAGLRQRLSCGRLMEFGESVPHCRASTPLAEKDGKVDEQLEAKFIKDAAAKGMVQLKGHR